MKDFYLFQANLQTCALTLDAKIVSEFSLSGKFWSSPRFSTLGAKSVLRGAKMFRDFQNIFPSLPLALYLSSRSPDIISLIIGKSVSANVLTHLRLRSRILSWKLRKGWFYWKTARQLLVLEGRIVFWEPKDLTCRQSIASLTGWSLFRLFW